MQLSLNERSNIYGVESFLIGKGVRVPEDFVSQCAGNLKTNSPYAKAISRRDLNELIKIADFWRPALQNKEEYDSFIVRCVYTLYRIQCISINNNPKCEALYIGNFAKVNEASEMAVCGHKTFCESKMASGGKALMYKP